ncbi:pentatricopeptide repeat-containing protein-like [Iris pallida]|uniref:Pentatricopeptide repeat-containing protein-like n=1 Tax=Iris pallida TaxID=29817 RepID=A0AAX6G728_IRIPA|nr:pentatricopeptide repeat-containing protein-like [Iris pallida]KAJ6824126.1 pentatricopeptide repeat-containing protein-like [Iris pallida]
MNKQPHVSNDLARHLSLLLHQSSATDHRAVRTASAVHAVLLKLHHSHSLGTSFSLWNKLLRIYSQSCPPKLAHNLFDTMPQRDPVSFNTLISARVRHRNRSTDSSSSLHLYSRLLAENLKPNPITLSTLLAGSASAALLEQIHSHSIKFGLNSDTFVGSSLVNAYEKCRGLAEAVRAFDEIDRADSVSWNVMIDACARSGGRAEAFEIFSRMRRDRGGGGGGDSGFDCFALTSVLKTCSTRGDLGLGLQLHACATKGGLASETAVGNSLVTMYSRCGEGMGPALSVFRNILEPNVISWTAAIGGLAQGGMAEDAAALYKRMVGAGGAENEFLFASVLPSFGAMASLELGRMVHSRVVRSEFRSDVGVGNALVDMYFKCGSAEDARLAFDEMGSRDSVSWTVMIAGLGQHGKVGEALEAFREMGAGGSRPDGVTFLAGLSACGHGGLVEEGLRLFRSMVVECEVEPRREHFACAVDMLGRAGRLEEAERFIEEMGMESNALAWEALLGACSMHEEMELGERAARKVMELEPGREGPYVQLSNIYAGRRMWEEKGKLRQRLDSSGLKKEAAQSWF